jgi:hypothetical protein
MAGLTEAPIDPEKVAAWIARVPTLRLDGRRPDAAAVVERLRSFWLPDESIVYIGKATSLASRVGQYYRTPVGEPRPHAGGHWLKTLADLGVLTVHYAEVQGSDPEDVEYDMMRAFMAGVSEGTRDRHPQPGLLLPFANLEGPGGRRHHGLSGTKLGAAGREVETSDRPQDTSEWYALEQVQLAAERAVPARASLPTPELGGARANLQGKDTFTVAEAEAIRSLLRDKEGADRGRQKTLRARIRGLRFYISDFSQDQQGFTSRDFDALVACGAVRLCD